MDRAPISSSADQGTQRHQYDRPTVLFHWLTALLVVALFGTAFTWGHVPREWHWRSVLEFVHVSLGILFAAVLLARIAWRWLRGRHLPPVDDGLQGLAAKAMHFVLYLLLAAQAALGFGLRWMQGEYFSFFGLFAIPDPFSPDRPLAHTLTDLHNYVAWTIVILAGGHALVALGHHYLMKDRVLGRMLPLARGA